MKFPRRVILTTWWLLDSLVRKLTPARRLIVVFALILILLPHSVQFGDDGLMVTIETSMFAFLLLLFVLMLELKDKLLARDELAEGRAVQIALMPEITPEIPGWSVWLFMRTANEVGI